MKGGKPAFLWDRKGKGEREAKQVHFCPCWCFHQQAFWGWSLFGLSPTRAAKGTLFLFAALALLNHVLHYQFFPLALGLFKLHRLR
jgi:hypothetical protein